MNPRDDPTLFLSGRSGQAESQAFSEQEFAARAPAPVSFPYCRIVSERSPVQKLQHLFLVYGNLVRFATILALAARLERGMGAEQAGQELRVLGAGDLEGWVQSLGRLTEGLADDALGRALDNFHRTLEVERTIRVREIIDMRAVESELGQLSNLARLQKSHPRNLGKVDESTLQQSLAYGLHAIREMLEQAGPLLAFRLIHRCRGAEGESEEIRELVGDREKFPSLGREVPDGMELDRVYAERPDGPPLDLHPLAVFQQCYECVRELADGDSREIFFYRGHSGRRIYYQGTRHQIATQELVSAFQQRLGGCQSLPDSDGGVPSDAKGLLESLTSRSIERARQSGRYQPDLYVARKEAEHQVLRQLCHGRQPVMLIQGECGLGKSALLDHLCLKLPRMGHWVLPLDLMSEGFLSDAASVVNESLGVAVGDLLKEAADALNVGKRLVILVDHLDRTASQDLFESFVALAADWERDYPFVRWVITMRPSFGTLMRNEAIGSRTLNANVLASFERDGLEGPIHEPFYRLPQLDKQERDTLYQRATQLDRFRVGTPMHLLKSSTQEMLRNPDLLLLTLAGYRAREIPPAMTINRILSRYWRKQVGKTAERKQFSRALVRAMYEKRTESASVDDLIDTGEEALAREVLAGEQSSLIEGLCRDGVLVRHGGGEGVFNEDLFSFTHPHVFGFLLADMLEGEQGPDARLMADLSREPVGRNLAAEPLFFLMARRAESKEIDWIEKVVSAGGPLMRTILLRLLQHEEMKLSRKKPAEQEDLGPLASELLRVEAGVYSLLDLAGQYYQRGNLARVQVLLTRLQASPVAEELRLDFLLARAAFAQGELKAALKHIKKAEKRHRDLGPSWDFKFSSTYAEVLLASDHAAKAEGLVRKLFDRLQVAEARDLLISCRVLLARCIAAGDNPEQATDLYERAIETAFQANDESQSRRIRERYVAHLMAQRDEAGARQQLEHLLEDDLSGADGEVRLLVQMAELEPWGSQARRERLQKALAVAFQLGPSLTLAEVALALGEAEEQADRMPQALDCFLQAVEVSCLFDDLQLIARSRDRLGHTQQDLGDYEQALENFSKSLELNKRLKDKAGLASVYHSIGQIFRSMGDGQKALDYYAKSGELKKELGDEQGQAATWLQMSVLLAARGDDAEAARVLKAAKLICAVVGDQCAMAACLWSDGLIEQERGDNERALKCYEEARKIQEVENDRRGLAATFSQMALIHKGRGDDYAALKLFEQAAEIHQRRGDRRGLSACYNNIGVIYDARGDFDQALTYYERDLEIAQELEDLSGTATSFNNLAILHYHQRNFVRALYYLEKSYGVYKQLGDKGAISAMEEKIARVKAKM